MYQWYYFSLSVFPVSAAKGINSFSIQSRTVPHKSPYIIIISYTACAVWSIYEWFVVTTLRLKSYDWHLLMEAMFCSTQYLLW